MRNALLLLALTMAAATASVTAYHIEPRTAALSGKVSGNPENGGVAQIITCNFDSLSYVELFAGAKGNGGAYTAQVLEDGDPVMQSVGYQDFDCRWVKFDQWTDTVAFTKGKELTVRFTRSGGDSIEYYYQTGNPGKKRDTSPISSLKRVKWRAPYAARFIPDNPAEFDDAGNIASAPRNASRSPATTTSSGTDRTQRVAVVPVASTSAP